MTRKKHVHFQSIKHFFGANQRKKTKRTELMGFSTASVLIWQLAGRGKAKKENGGFAIFQFP
jgi:hypothetical protein